MVNLCYHAYRELSYGSIVKMILKHLYTIVLTTQA